MDSSMKPILKHGYFWDVTTKSGEYVAMYPCADYAEVQVNEMHEGDYSLQFDIKKVGPGWFGQMVLHDADYGDWVGPFDTQKDALDELKFAHGLEEE